MESKPGLWTERLIIVNMLMLPQLIYRYFQCKLHQNLKRHFWRNWQADYKINIKRKPKITKSILNKKNKLGGFMPPDFKSYYKVTIISTKGKMIDTD